MSTARTVIGCLAEDYTPELADICEAYLAQLPPETVQIPERASRARDVAASFLSAAGRDARSVHPPTP